VQLSESPDAKKSSHFVNLEPSHDITPLLQTDPSARQVSDSSPDSFDQVMIAAFLAEKPDSLTYL
jgi:hypothetical protein